MKTAICILGLFLSCPLGVARAADYHIKVVEVKPIESYPAQASAGGVTIAANPYMTDEESETAFDVKRLNSRGYLPVHVIIKNDTAYYLTIHTRNVLLFTPNGEQLYSTPATIVVDNVVRAGLTKKDPKKSDEPETLSKKGSPLTDFTSKELVTASIDPGATVDGFLFFFTQPSTKKSSKKNKKNPFASSTLYIPKVEEEGTQRPFGPFTIHLDAAVQGRDVEGGVPEASSRK
jgi:hypothetical protein